MWTTHKHAGSDVQMGIFGIFSGFTGALLQAQKGNSSKQQMVDRTRASLTSASIVAAETDLQEQEKEKEKKEKQ